MSLEKASGPETALLPTNSTSPKRKKSYHRILFHGVFKCQNGNIPNPNPNAQRGFPLKYIILLWLTGKTWLRNLAAGEDFGEKLSHPGKQSGIPRE